MTRPPRPDVGAKLEHPRLAEDRGPDARAACVVHEDRHLEPAGFLGDLEETLPRQQLVRDGESREHEQVRTFDRTAVAEVPAGERNAAHDGRVRVARGDSDDRRARRHEDLHRGDRSGRHPIRNEHVVASGNAPEVLQREFGQPLAHERGREIVVEDRRVHVADVERTLEAREVEQRPVAVTALDDPPGGAELRDVVARVAQDLAALVGNHARWVMP